ncbi:unnamed protein product [Nyctereutes procyonoides]|uniref:(raccoon dog) hypothetical protein n=1 Tax=Nyctereutes procyonoides TaxID=34880 RepID=A0A811ZG78_NYCPR|nr:unnamed protein product [Nyctereutes procyonoides]
MFSNGLPLRQHQRLPLASGSSTDGLSAGTVPHAAPQREPWSPPSHRGLPWGRLPEPPPGLSQRQRQGHSGFIHLHRDSLRGCSHTTPHSPQRAVRGPQTRPLGCLPSPRRPRPRLPGPSGCGTRVRDGRTLHCGPRAAHGRSGAGAAAAAAAAAARAPQAHPPAPPPAPRGCGACARARRPPRAGGRAPRPVLLSLVPRPSALSQEGGGRLRHLWVRVPVGTVDQCPALRRRVFSAVGLPAARSVLAQRRRPGKGLRGGGSRLPAPGSRLPAPGSWQPRRRASVSAFLAFKILLYSPFTFIVIIDMVGFMSAILIFVFYTFPTMFLCPQYLI